MADSTLDGPFLAPLGSVEPHAPMLSVPPDDQMLYKMMTVENLLGSIVGSYLHFNRVDSYTDLDNADSHDGEQLPMDQPGNAMAKFAKAPDFSVADYYARSRSRTYACCFSQQNSPHIWSNYANGSKKGKLCVAFNFGKLRAALNRTLQPGNAALEYNGVRCRQIFSLNYGTVEYVDWNSHQANEQHLPNPIKYTYLKNRVKFGKEHELRVSLSTIGVGHFVLDDGKLIDFPPNLQVVFDFKAAIADGTIEAISLAQDCDADFLRTELCRLRIVAKEYCGQK